MKVINITIIYTDRTQVIITIDNVRDNSEDARLDVGNQFEVSVVIAQPCHGTYGQFGSTNDDENARVSLRNVQMITKNLIL